MSRNTQPLLRASLWLVLGVGCSGAEHGGGPSPVPSLSKENANESEDEEADGSTGEPDDAEYAFPARAPSDPQAMYGCNFVETFDGPTGAPWPEPWQALGGVAKADLRSGWGRLAPELSKYSLGRMGAPIACQDFSATVTVMFSDPGTQGAAIYGRQSGGYLRETSPFGRGYSVFAEAFRDPIGVGLWRELGGVEQDLTPVAESEIEPLVPYRMRLQVTQIDEGESLLQGKLWKAGQPEPDAWSVQYVDNGSSFQNAHGAIALDVWSILVEGDMPMASDVYFDDLVVTPPTTKPGLPTDFSN